MPFEGNAEFEFNLKPYDSEEKIEHFIDNGNQFLELNLGQTLSKHPN
jgi:hypothetical protein